MLKKSASMVGLSLMVAACSGGGGAGPSGAGGAGPGGGGGSGGQGGQGGGGPVCGALFPQDANLVDVKAAYGAKGDGITDDTAALKKAIAENVGSHRTLLLPTGTYLVREQLDFRDTEGRWRSYLSLQGEGAGCTVLKLADAAEGFGDAMAPKPVLRPGSKTEDPACSNFGKDDGDGGGNCAFGNYVLDLTVDTGSKNAGAVGIDFIASNWGAVKNVDIASGDGGGAVGLRLTREVGPALIKGVRVDGFRVGIEASRDLYGITLEHITLRRQTEAGIKNQGNMLAIRGLKSDNKVPAVVNEDPLGLVALIDSALEGGAAERAAVENSGVMLARGLTTAGYGAAIRMGSTEVPAGAVDEWLSHPPLELFSTSKQSLRLPVEETPTFAAPLEAWANVEAFGAKRDDDVDDADALQAAIDSGKQVVYLPFGRYVLNKTVQVRGAVRRIVAFQSVLGGSAAPMLRVEGVDGPSVILERARGLEGGVEHASPAALAVVHAVDVRLLPPAPGAGPLFLEDTCCKNFVTGKRPVWARQLNVESGITPQIDNAGGTLWILGMKTEGTHTNLRTAEGGKTELLGAMFYGTGGPNEPAVVVEGASVSLTYTEVTYTDVTDYDVHVRQTQGGQTKDLGQDALVWRGYGGMMPLFVSQP